MIEWLLTSVDYAELAGSEHFVREDLVDLTDIRTDVFSIPIIIIRRF